MEPQNQTIDSTTSEFRSDHHLRFDPNEMPTVNSTNPNYHPSSMNTSHVSETTSIASTEKLKTEFKKGPQQVEDIITKLKRVSKEQCMLILIFRTKSSRNFILGNHAFHNIMILQKKGREMIPKQSKRAT